MQGQQQLFGLKALEKGPRAAGAQALDCPAGRCRGSVAGPSPQPVPWVSVGSRGSRQVPGREQAPSLSKSSLCLWVNSSLF